MAAMRDDPIDAFRREMTGEAPPMAEIPDRCGRFVSRAVRGLHSSDPAVDHEDLRQDAYLGMAAAARRYDERSGVRFETYAYTRARGQVIDNQRRMQHLRQSERPAQTLSLDWSWEMFLNSDRLKARSYPGISAPQEEQPEPVSERREASERVWSLVAGLPELQARLIYLLFRDGLSLRQAAKELGESEGTLRALRAEAIAALAPLAEAAGLVSG